MSLFGHLDLMFDQNKVLKCIFFFYYRPFRSITLIFCMKKIQTHRITFIYDSFIEIKKIISAKIGLKN